MSTGLAMRQPAETESRRSSPSSDSSVAAVKIDADEGHDKVPLGILRIRNSLGSADDAHRNGLPAEALLLRSLEHRGTLHSKSTTAKSGQDDGASTVIRVWARTNDVHRDKSPKHREDLKALISALDPSRESWLALDDVEETTGSRRNGYSRKGTLSSNGCMGPFHPKPSEGRLESLFYIFNTLPSPQPESERILDEYLALIASELAQAVWQPSCLRSQLQPFQARSVAMMLERETSPRLQIDPRLSLLESPGMQPIYFDKLQGQLYLRPSQYEEACGGILAETMGLGKTLIVLVVIWITRGYLPTIPAASALIRPHDQPQSITHGCSSLKTLATRSIRQYNVQWAADFRRLSEYGDWTEPLTAYLQDQTCCYYEEDIPSRMSRHAPSLQPQKKIYRTSATLIIVPDNLLVQWRTETRIHFQEGSLRLYEVRAGAPLDLHAILSSDIMLIGRRALGVELGDAPTVLEEANSGDIPLLERLHFLRIIIDEGHAFLKTGMSEAATIKLARIRADRRWILTGTPSSGLMGEEIALASDETNVLESNGAESKRQKLLERRRNEINPAQEKTDLAALGRMATKFLHCRPWCNKGDDEASWSKYVTSLLEGDHRRTADLRRVLEGIVVRHTLEDVQRDFQLPDLQNTIVRLEPCYFDKLSLNLFVAAFVTNAVASERTDQDYLFHARNRRSLETIFRNVRQAAFFWTGYTTKMISSLAGHAQEYHLNDAKAIDPDDKASLASVLRITELALSSILHKTFTSREDVGLLIRDFEGKAAEQWCIGPSEADMNWMTSTDILEAQSFLHTHIFDNDPLTGLAAHHERLRSHSSGNKASDIRYYAARMKRKRDVILDNASTKRAKADNTEPLAFENGGPLVHRSQDTSATQNSAAHSKAPKSALKKTPAHPAPLPEAYGQVARAQVIGTASAKLTYLMDQVRLYGHEEKMIIFYEAPFIAYFIGQTLELMGVEHLIYGSSLSDATRATYLEAFSTQPAYRVLLMDLRQAAQGLNITAASRIYFVNAVWNPSVEAQAIKRAHRFGQSRPVHVQTLVLRDTLEDRMVQRRKTMSASEHQRASAGPLQDPAMADIIRTATFIPFTDQELHPGPSQCAPLAEPMQLFAREFIEQNR